MICRPDQSVMRSIQMTRPPVESPPKVVVTLDQQHLGAKPGRSYGGGRSGRAAADHQHVSFGEDRNLARRLKNSFGGAGAPHSTAATEQLNALRGPDAAAVIAAARGLAENFALPRRSYARRGSLLFVMP